MSEHLSASRSSQNKSFARSQVSTQGGDSKDLIISQLMREINELKVNDQDYTNLNLQLNTIENRYSLLKSEKDGKEIEFLKKAESLIARLADTRGVIDTSQKAIAEKEQDIRVLDEDLDKISQVIQTKNEAIKQMSFEGEDLDSRKESLEIELIELRRQINVTETEKFELLTQLQNMESHLEDCILSERELDEQITQNDSMVEATAQNNDMLRAEIDDIEKENTQMRDLISQKQGEIEEFEREAQTLESQLVNEENVKRRLHDEVSDLNNVLAKEIIESNMRQNDLIKLEGLIR